MRTQDAHARHCLPGASPRVPSLRSPYEVQLAHAANCSTNHNSRHQTNAIKSVSCDIRPGPSSPRNPSFATGIFRFGGNVSYLPTRHDVKAQGRWSVIFHARFLRAQNTPFAATPGTVRMPAHEQVCPLRVSVHVRKRRVEEAHVSMHFPTIRHSPSKGIRRPQAPLHSSERLSFPHGPDIGIRRPSQKRVPT